MQNGPLCGQVVLVIEDEPLIAVGLQESLEGAGAEAARADLEDSQAFVRQRKLSAAVLDCHPVSRERRALIRRLRQHGVPFLFYSVEPPADVTTERDVLFVAKPCPADKIIAAVGYLLRMDVRPPVRHR